MHDPIGVSGVQTVPNTLQSRGCLTPRRIAPHSHALLSATARVSRANRFSASNAADAQRAERHHAQAAPFERAAQLEHLRHERLRLDVAVARDRAGELVLDL